MTGDRAAMSELMFYKEAVGYGTQRLENNKDMVKSSDTTFLVSNFKALQNALRRIQFFEAAFVLPDNTFNLAFYVEPNQWLLSMWQTMGKLIKDFRSLEKIYLILDIDKHLKIKKGLVFQKGFISGSTGLIQAISSNGTRMDVYQDATKRKILWDLHSEAWHIKTKLLKTGVGAKIKIVQ
jgi:hypothetical protein